MDNYEINISNTLLTSLSSYATTIARVPIEKMLEAADFVAVITIESGELIKNKGTECGAKYTAKIDSTIKNKLDLKDSTIDFGVASRYKIGQQYLAVLKKTKTRFAYLGSTNSRSEKRRIENENKCNEVYPEYRVIHNIFGMFETGLERDPEYKGDETKMTFEEMQENGVYRNTILVYPKFVHIEENIKKYEVTYKSCLSYQEGCILIDMEDLLSSLGYKYKKFITNKVRS